MRGHGVVCGLTVVCGLWSQYMYGGAGIWPLSTKSEGKEEAECDTELKTDRDLCQSAQLIAELL